MNIEVDFYIPPCFFDSANKGNNFESVTERIAKAVLEDILNYKNVIPGDPNKHQPDYLSGNEGFEVTIAESNTLIQHLKGRMQGDIVTSDLEKDLIESICKMVQKKSHKHYDRQTSLIVLILNPVIHWYYELWSKEQQNTIMWSKYATSRDNLFDKLYSDYLVNNCHFKNIFILQPTLKQKYALYDIKAFSEQRDFIYEIGIKDGREKAYPTFQLVHMVGSTFPIHYIINPVQGEKNDE